MNKNRDTDLTAAEPQKEFFFRQKKKKETENSDLLGVNIWPGR